MKAHPLTERQQKTLDIIRRHLKVRGVPPSRPEIARELGLRHQGGVDAHLNALAKKGFVKVFPNVERGLKLLREGAPVFDPEGLPEVADAEPIVAEEREPARLTDFDSFVQAVRGAPGLLRARARRLARARGLSRRRHRGGAARARSERRRPRGGAGRAGDHAQTFAAHRRCVRRAPAPEHEPEAPQHPSSTRRPRMSRSWASSSGPSWECPRSPE